MKGTHRMAIFAALAVLLVAALVNTNAPAMAVDTSGFRNGIEFGMSPSKVKALEQSKPAADGWESQYASGIYHLYYTGQKYIGYSCDIMYLFGDDGLYNIGIYFDVGTGSMDRVIDRATDDFMDIDDAIIDAYGLYDTDVPYDGFGEGTFSTLWPRDAGRGYEIIHSINTQTRFGVRHFIGYLYKPSSYYNSLVRFTDFVPTVPTLPLSIWP